MAKQKKNFTKPIVSLQRQVEILADRGLTIDDQNLAIQQLKYIGYYRLSGYYKFFGDPEDPDGQRFRAGTHFNDVLHVYTFDRRLRVLLGEALERIEVAVKTNICHEYSTIKGIFWLTDPDNFGINTHDEIMQDVVEALGIPDKIRHVFIEHYYETYLDPHPPAWMIMETISFGAISRIFMRSRGELQTPVANIYGINKTVLESWLHTLTVARNVCAHHARLWNRRFSFAPKLPRKYGDWPPTSLNRLYVVCCIVHHMIRIIDGNTEWARKLRVLISERGNLPLSAMGFPDDWESQPFWGFQPQNAPMSTA